MSTSEKNHQLDINDSFYIGNAVCTISTIHTFEDTLHYGFAYRGSNGQSQAGWMPVEFVDQYMWHDKRPNVFNPEDVKAGDMVVLVHEQRGPFKVQSVTGRFNSKVFCAEIGQELNATLFMKVKPEPQSKQS